MTQFCVYTADKDFLTVIKWLSERGVRAEPHLNRTRFWIPDGKGLTEFILRWGHTCPAVEEQESYQL